MIINLRCRKRLFNCSSTYMPKPIRIYESFKRFALSVCRHETPHLVYHGLEKGHLSWLPKKIHSLRPEYPKRDPKKSHWFQLWKTHWLHKNPFIHSKNSNRLQLIFTVNPFNPSANFGNASSICSSTCKIQNLPVRKSTRFIKNKKQLVVRLPGKVILS